MSLAAYLKYSWFALFLPLLGFSACSGNESGVNTNESGLPHGSSGAHAASGASGSGNIGGMSALVGSTGGFVFSAQGGSIASSSAGAPGGSANTGGLPGLASGGSIGVSGAASAAAGGSSNSGGTSSGGSAGHVGAAGSSAAFAKVASILGSNCGIKGCHADKETPHFVPGPMLYETLTGPNTVLAECGYTKMVEAGDPAKSALVRLMNRKCDGFTMPPTCNKTTCLAAADLQALSDWIQAGAPP